MEMDIEKEMEIPPTKADNTAISHVEVHDVVGVILLGVVALVALIALVKSHDRYTALVERFLDERK